MNNKKDLKYYLCLHYSIIIDPVIEEGEQFFLATARELDKQMFYGVGVSEGEAIEELKISMKEMFVFCLDEGIHIPEPLETPVAHYSGKFIVRTSPSIHQYLMETAKLNNQSMNSCFSTILTQYLTMNAITTSATEMIREALCAEIKKVGDTWVRSQQNSEKPKAVSEKDKVYVPANAS